jgi:hypothetical protein
MVMPISRPRNTRADRRRDGGKHQPQGMMSINIYIYLLDFSMLDRRPIDANNNVLVVRIY